MTEKKPKGVTAKAFETMAKKKAAATPQERAANKAKMKKQVEDMKARGTKVVENATGHRLTLSASGPAPGAPLFTDEPDES